MVVYYLDTSALVKLYVREPGTDRMLRLAGLAEGHTLVVLALARVEFRSAVRRRERAGDIPPESASELIGKLEDHWEKRYVIQPVTGAVMEEATALLDRQPLRAYDAVQLAGCLVLRATLGVGVPWFVCSDPELLETARAEGVSVLDPVASP